MSKWNDRFNRIGDKSLTFLNEIETLIKHGYVLQRIMTRVIVYTRTVAQSEKKIFLKIFQ